MQIMPAETLTDKAAAATVMTVLLTIASLTLTIASLTLTIASLTLTTTPTTTSIATKLTQSSMNGLMLTHQLRT